MVLTPQEQFAYEAFRRNPETKFFQILVEEAVAQALSGFIAKLNAAKAESKLYSIKEICENFRVTPATVHNWRKKGWLVGSRMGKNRYFTRDEIDLSIRLYQIGDRY
ncbi:MAG TPA: helix-turn-helix domain-containing protein [Mucilaginibacter sp.]|nr:helix-turn-helix domain-containing protein [Mucilaginibacter sp.]